MFENIARNAAVIMFAILLVTACQDDQPQSQSYRVGILQFVDLLAAVEDGFKAGMAELGYTEGENVVYVYRNVNGNLDALNCMTRELLDEQVDLIVSITTQASIAAMQTSKDAATPIVFVLVSDPVRAGLVASLKQPGGRITGIRDGSTVTAGKRLELLHMMAPSIQKVLSVYSYEESLLPAAEELQKAASKLGLGLIEKQVRSSEEAVAAFQAVQPGEVDAIFVPSDAIILTAIEEITALATRDSLPYIFPGNSPGVMAYHGENIYQSGRQAAGLVDKILQGSDPAVLPVEFSKEFYLGINLSIAEKMGLILSEEILVVADEVIK